MRYKAGQMIMIREDLETSSEGAMVVPGMLKHAGEILIVQDIKNVFGADYKLVDAYEAKRNNYVWDDNMIDHEATARLNEPDGPIIEDSRNRTHADICKRLTDMYNQKNADYGDSFSKSYEKYGSMMAAIRLSDKLNRFENLINSKSRVDESLIDTLMDLANYAIMTVMEMERENESK